MGDTIEQFDLVGILSIDRFVWLSTQRTDDYRGQWAVIHVEKDWLVICRGDMTGRILKTDVRLLVKYSLDSMFEYMRRAAGYANLQEEKNARKATS